MNISLAVIRFVYMVTIILISFYLGSKSPKHGWLIGYITGILIIGVPLVYDIITNVYCP